MSSSRTDTPGSKPRQPIPAPAGSSANRPKLTVSHESDPDILSSPPQTDDTPTIITKNTASVTPEIDHAAGIRGRRLAHFELIEPIGVGGMAAVLRARDTQLDRFVALKILPQEMASDSENVRRFHQEARSAAKLDHENIARVFFCGEDQRLHFIAFEFVNGDNLRTILERRGRLPVAEALHYMIQVAAGLSHAAARGVVHRDIKPSNIIITPTGRAKLVDMGLARTMERKDEHDLTQSGVTLGTFDYISPEQALEPREADVRSDIYSLGCTFYHLLTGRPPVPEGTAARKLHCHQHVKPIDPRQIVPTLPLEVVQVLDRMMAKNPRDRFQTPEELVHRLLLAAKSLGVNPEVPEGVLALETALPAPPAGRPLIWAAMAAIAIIALVLILNPLTNTNTTPRQGTNTRPDGKDGGPTVKDSAPLAKGNENPPPIRPSDGTPADHVYTTGATPNVNELVKWLAQRKNAAKIELRLAGEYAFSSPESGKAAVLLLQCKHLIIKPRDASARPVIRLSYDPRVNAEKWVAMTVACQDSHIEGVRFHVDSAGASDVDTAALHFQGGKHRVERCEFIQGQPALFRVTDKRAASVIADAGRSRGEVTLRECVFLGYEQVSQDSRSGANIGGQDAVVRRGSMRVTADGCVFGPHVAAFRIEGMGEGEDGKITVRQCSILLPAHRSAAFDVADGANVKLDVSQSLISRLDEPTSQSKEKEGTALLRQETATDPIRYKGSDNVYHDLDGYWVVGDEWRKAGWGDFRSVRKESVEDASRLLLHWPWLETPADLGRCLDRQELAQAFRLNEKMPALRKNGNSQRETVGPEVVLGERLIPTTRTLPELDDTSSAVARRILLVEDDPRGDSLNSVYPTLTQAIASAAIGDTILIRHEGELAVDPIGLNKKTLSNLTIRPARGFRPVLTLGESSASETALFRVQDGKLRLEGLHFRLGPGKKAFTSLAVVALAGDGLCEMHQCAVTLERSGDTAVALASLLAKTDKEMKLDMPPVRKPEQGPQLILENTFVRGEGHLLWTKTSRASELALKNCVAALSGSLFHLDVEGDMTAPPTGHKMSVKLTNTTTYLGGHLINMMNNQVRSLVPVKVKAMRSLFVAAAAGRALIQLEGQGLAEDSALTADSRKFEWEGGPNAYGGYMHILAQVPVGSEKMAPIPWKSDTWKIKMAGEDSSTFEAKLNGTLAETKYTQVLPAQLGRVKDAPDCGAKVSDKTFPRVER